MIRYLRTETSGPLFERMKAKLAGIASHTGMSGVFRLQGSDVYRVESIERVPGPVLPPPPARRNLLAAVRDCAQRIGAVTDLQSLLDSALACIERELLRRPRADPACATRREGASTRWRAAAIPIPAWDPRSRWGTA